MRKIHRWIGMGLVRLPDASKKTEAKKMESPQKISEITGLERERAERERES